MTARLRFNLGGDISQTTALQRYRMCKDPKNDGVAHICVTQAQ